MSTRFLAPLLALTSALLAGPVELHVALSGNNANPGTADAPFASVWRAQNEIRKLKQIGKLPEGAVVRVHKGAYCLNAPLVFEAQDGGAAAAPIVYRSHGDGEVRLVGGVEAKGFKPFRGNILKADVRGLHLPGVGAEGKGNHPAAKLGNRFRGNVPRTELFFQGRRMPLARWPNEIPDGKRMGEWAYVPKVTERTRTWMHFPNDRIKNWSRPAEAQVHIFPWYNYMDCYVGVKSVDPAKKIVQFAQPTSYTIQPGRRFYVRNVFEELDAPGEWYLDRAKGVLYFWPPAPMSEGRVFLSRINPVVHLKETSHVTIRGFTIEGSRGAGVVVEGGSYNTIAACTIRNTMAEGIRISGANNRAVGNDIHDTGLHGILLAGGDRKTLTPGKNVADNNHIWRTSRVILTYTPGVHVSGVGNRVSHNLIHDCPHMALGMSGNDHVFEFNEIHHAMLITSHGGAFYTGRDWTYRGNVIRYNSFHDINGYGFEKIDYDKGVFQYASPTKLAGCFAIHFDDQVSGFHVYGNLFYRIGIEAIRMGGGRDFLIENNVFVDAGPPVHIDARGLGWQKRSIQGGTIGKRLTAMPYKQPPWSTRYPELVDILDDHPGWPRDNKVLRNVMVVKGVLYDFKPMCPQTTQVDYNVLWRRGEAIDVYAKFVAKKGGGQMPFAEWRKLGYDTHSVIADPKFVDAANDDFRLRDDSPALKLGFKPIPVEKIGLYKDELRASWPPPVDKRKMPGRAVETYPIPGFVPLGARGPSRFTAPFSKKPITIDGVIEPDEWLGADPKKAMLIARDIQDQPTAPKSYAWLVHDGESLFVAVRNNVDPKRPIRMTNKWGRDDAVEVAIRNPASGKAVFALRGYPNGKFGCTTETGLSAKEAARVGKAVKFAAKVVNKREWTCEFQIPWAAIQTDPAIQQELPFNITVRKSASYRWIMWRGTGGNSWWVDKAGTLALEKK